MRIPPQDKGRAGRARIAATGRGNEVIAALDTVDHRTVHVPSAAHLTGQDLNLLRAHPSDRR